MGGVSVRHLSELSGSSAEHIELLLDDGFTALAGSLVWSAADDEHEDLDGPDMSFDWVSEALADTAARLPAQIPAPPPTVLLRNAAVVRWSVRAIPVAGVAACAAVVAAVALPEPAEVHGPAIYVQHGSGAEGVAPIYVSGSDLAPEPAVDGGPSPEPTVRLRSIALTSLLDAPARADAPIPPEARLPAAPHPTGDDGRLETAPQRGRRTPGAAAQQARTVRERPQGSAGERWRRHRRGRRGRHWRGRRGWRGRRAGTAAGGRRDDRALTGGAGSAAAPPRVARRAPSQVAPQTPRNRRGRRRGGWPGGVAATGGLARSPRRGRGAAPERNRAAAAVPMRGRTGRGRPRPLRAGRGPARAVPASAAARRVAGSAGCTRPMSHLPRTAAPGSVPGAGGGPSVPRRTARRRRTVRRGGCRSQVRWRGRAVACGDGRLDAAAIAGNGRAGPGARRGRSERGSTCRLRIRWPSARSATRRRAPRSPSPRTPPPTPPLGLPPPEIPPPGTPPRTPAPGRPPLQPRPAPSTPPPRPNPPSGASPTQPHPTDRRAAAAAKPASRQTAAAGKPAKRAAAEKSAARATAEDPSARQATGAGKPPARHAATAGKSAQRDTAEKRATQHAPTGGDRPSSDDAAGDRATGAPDD